MRDLKCQFYNNLRHLPGNSRGNMGRSDGEWIRGETSDAMEGIMNITTARGGEKPQGGACPFQRIWKEHTWGWAIWQQAMLGTR